MKDCNIILKSNFLLIFIYLYKKIKDNYVSNIVVRNK